MATDHIDYPAPPAPGGIEPASEVPPPARRTRRRITDDELFELLRAGEAEGANPAELCAGRGVRLPAYCVWKQKYRDLTLSELKQQRRQESRRGRTIAMAVVGAILGSAAGVGFFVTFGESPATARPLTQRAAKTVPAVRAPVATAVAAPPAPGVRPSAASSSPADTDRAATAPTSSSDVRLSARSPAPASGTPPRSPAAAGDAQRLAAAVPRLPADDDGIVVQVAAVPDWAEAQDILKRLNGAGHRAYALAANVQNAPMYRVRIGPFQTRRAAVDAVRTLQRDGYEQPWIVR